MFRLRFGCVEEEGLWPLMSLRSDSPKASFVID